MRLRYFLVAALLAATAAQAQQINPITQAVLKGYTELINQNPKDYATLYQRGAQYYSLSQYEAALSDISRAIDCTPAKEKDLLMQEYSLMADICTELKEYDKALTAVDNALAIEPQNYANIYKRGNICLYLNRPQDAYNSFASLQRLKSRSQEAYFGMAKSAVMLGRKDEARALIDEAEKADPSNYITYCRIGDLYRDLGDNQQAAASYLSAFGLADDTTRPMESLIELGRADFPSVSAAMDFALSKTANKTPVLFLKGNIAQYTGNYLPAYDAFSKLLKEPQGQEASVYAQMSRSALALNKIDEALQNADIALQREATAENYAVKAQAELAKGSFASALASAKKALALDGSNREASLVAAEANIGLKEYDAAIDVLNEMIMNDATDPLPLMIRAFINNGPKNNARQAAADYARVGSMPADSFPGYLYKALAKTSNGKKLDGDAIMAEAIKGSTNPDDYYCASVYYSQAGDLSKGRDMLQRAVELGYQNIYNVDRKSTANLTVAPLRHLK